MVVIDLYLGIRLEVEMLSRHRCWGVSPSEGDLTIPCSLGVEDTTIVCPPSHTSP